MGLFDVFGSGKKKAEEEERVLAQRQAREHDETVAAQKDAHAALHWPTNPGINRMNVKDAAATRIDDPITVERKDEIGSLIYEPRISPDDVKDLNLQELLFLLVTHEAYNREAALTNYEANHRVVYNDLLRRIHEAQRLYVIYDKRTGYPLIDGGCVNVYLDKEHAEQASAVYNTQFRVTAVVSGFGENEEPDENGRKKMSLFDYLYFLGTENVLIDNGWYKALIRRSEISAPMGFNADPTKTPPSNPAFVFALTDFVQESAWPVKYEHRDEILKKKQERVFALMQNATFIVPMTQVDGTDEATQEPRKEVRCPILNIKDHKFLPVFTDMQEYAKNLKNAEGYRPAGFAFKNLTRLLEGVDGVIVNANGQRLIITKAKVLELARQ